MKILIADKLSETIIKMLDSMDVTYEWQPSLKAETLPENIGDAEVLIVRSTKVTKETIDAGASLSLIIRAGAGVNTIDLKAASEKGIYVANCPGKNTAAVAELAIGHLIAADRRIPAAALDLKNGKWEKKEYGKAKGLKGRTLGIIGLGAIGKAVAKRAKGLEMNVLAWSRSLTSEKADSLGIGFLSSPEEIATRADCITVHLAAKPDTKHFIGKNFFAKIKNGAIFINTSRGEIVDTEELKKAIKEKNLRVGIDVYENEPAAGDKTFADSELAELVNGTPHIGASTDQATEAVAEEVVKIIADYKKNGKPEDSVNMLEKSSATYNMTIRHYNHIGVLASIFDSLRDGGINIEEVENRIFQGEKTAVCFLKLDDKPSDKLISKIENDQNIIHTMLS